MAWMTKEEFLAKYGAEVELEFDHYYKYQFWFCRYHTDPEGGRIKILATDDEGNCGDIYKKMVDSEERKVLGLCVMGRAVDAEGKEIDSFNE